MNKNKKLQIRSPGDAARRCYLFLSKQRKSLGFALALIALGAGHLALRRYCFSLPLMSDEGEYAYEARVWSQGGLPYRDAYFQKPPMIVVLYRAAYAVWPQDILAPRRLAVVFSWLTMLFLFWLTPWSWNPAARLLAPALYGVLSTSPIGSLGFPANTEIFLCAFMSLSALAISRHFRSARPAGWIFVSGLAAGAAVMTKQTALWTGLAFAAVSLHAWRRRLNWRLAFAFSCGAAIPFIAFFGYFFLRGGLGILIQDAYQNNLSYMSTVIGTSSFRSHTRWFLSAVIPKFLIGDWPIWGAALIGMVLTPAQWESPETLGTLWLGTGLTGALTGLLLFPYYFLQAFPPLAIMAATGIERLGERGWNKRIVWPAAAALCLYPVLIRSQAYFMDPPRVLAGRLLYPNPLFEAVDIANYIRAHTAPDDTIYVFGAEPHIYVYADRKAATEHIFVYPLTMFPIQASEITRELVNLEAASPKFIVYSTQPGSTIIAWRMGERFRDGVQDLLRRRYTLVGRADFPANPSQARGLEPAHGEPDWSSKSSLFLFKLNGSP